MKLLQWSAVVAALAIFQAHAEIPRPASQTTVTVVYTDSSSSLPTEEVSFEFDRVYALLQESRDKKAPTTITIPLGNQGFAEFTVQGVTKHIGQVMWTGRQFAPVQHFYLGFAGTAKNGDRVQGFISDQSFSAIVQNSEAGRILVQSKSLQVGDGKPGSGDTAVVEALESHSAKLEPDLNPADFKSPVDANGLVRLRHIGLFFTLTDNIFHTIDPNGDPLVFNQKVVDWVTNFSMQVNALLMAEIGVTIDPISALGPNGELLEPEKDGVKFIVQPQGGFSGQPSNSIFGDPSVPFTAVGWAIANHEFQAWIVSGQPNLAAWWDAGMVLGAIDDSINTDPSESKAYISGLCDPLHKGKSYRAPPKDGFDKIQHIEGALHELGHLMGALHTFSSQIGDCASTFNASSAIEPGSGSTRMSYIGQCAPDIVEPYDPNKFYYFHGKSIEQINAFLTNLEASNTCISHAPTKNRPPVLTVSKNPQLNVVPKDVRFELTAHLADPELDDLVTAAFQNKDPSLIPQKAKLEGAGRVNWEQIDLFGTNPGPVYRSFPPQIADHNFIIPIPFHYLKYYSRSFPNKKTPLGTQWDPLMTEAAQLTFRATAWDTNADAGAGFPAFVSADVPVTVNGDKPWFIFPQANKMLTAGMPYDITWLPNFAASQAKFFSLVISYRDPWFSWRKLNVEYGAPGSKAVFPAIVFPSQLVMPYTTQVRLEYKTLGDVTWYVESAEFNVVP